MGRWLGSVVVGIGEGVGDGAVREEHWELWVWVRVKMRFVGIEGLDFGGAIWREGVDLV